MNVWDYVVLAFAALIFIFVCFNAVSELGSAPFWKKAGVFVCMAMALAVGMAAGLAAIVFFINYDLPIN